MSKAQSNKMEHTEQTLGLQILNSIMSYLVHKLKPASILKITSIVIPPVAINQSINQS